MVGGKGSPTRGLSAGPAPVGTKFGSVVTTILSIIWPSSRIQRLIVCTPACVISNRERPSGVASTPPTQVKLVPPGTRRVPQHPSSMLFKVGSGLSPFKPALNELPPPSDPLNQI